MFVECDYSATLNKISKQAREQAKLLLQAEVVSLCTPERRLLGHKVELATGEGSTYQFDEVVIATSLGWLAHISQASRLPRSSRPATK